MRLAIVLFIVCALAITMAGARPVTAIPPGTVVPVQLHTRLDSRRCHAGDKLRATVAQDVPLYNGSKIKVGTVITGEVLSATPAGDSQPASIAFRFNQMMIGRQALPVTMHLRALASPQQIRQAEYPTALFEKQPFNLTTLQIGGTDVVYRGGGPVSDGQQIVGTPIEGISADLGVLSHVAAYPGKPCHGPVAGNDNPQALWLFSHDACGVYGYDFTNLRTPENDASGLIVLESTKGNIDVLRGSALLLRTNAPETK